MIAHGVTFVGWMLEYESIAPPGDKTEIWNEAVDRSQQSETRVVETTYRLLRVHADDEPCPICPPTGTPGEGLPKIKKCDGGHGGPRCADPECWNDTGGPPVVFVAPVAGEGDPPSREDNALGGLHPEKT